MLAERADRAPALGVVAFASTRLVVAVEQMRIAAHRPVWTNQRIGRQFLAAAARDQHLAFGDYGSGEVQDDRLGIGARDADAERRRREPPVDAAERRDEHAAGRIDEMHGDERRLRSERRPIADPPDVPRIAQRDDG